MKHFKIITIIILLISHSIFSQDEIIKGDPDGIIKNNVFICKNFDWKIKIPENYKISSKSDLEQLHSKGIKRVQESNPNTNIDKVRNNLISFEINAQNTFSSSLSILPDRKITLMEHKKQFVELLTNALEQVKGARFEKTVSNIKLGKYDFYKVKIEGFTTNNQLVITQIYYNAIIENEIFGVLITYNDAEQGKILEENFITSFN